MTRLGIEIERRGLLRVVQTLEQGEKRAQDLRPAWQAVSDVISPEMEALFAAQGAHGGPGWSRLRPATIARRTAAHLTPIRVGWARGRMAQSLIEPTYPGAIEDRQPLDYTRGTSVGVQTKRGTLSYPRIFEYGRRGQVPRPIFGRLFREGNPRVMNRVAEAIAKHVLPGP